MKSKNKKRDVSNHGLKEQNRKLKSDLDQFKRLMILLILLVFVSVLSQALYYYSIEYEKKSNFLQPSQQVDKRKEEQSMDESLDVTSEQVTHLVQSIDVFNNQLESANFFGYLYKKDSYTSENISNKAKIFMALSNISFVDHQELIDDQDNVTIPRQMVFQKMKDLLGEKITYEDESLVDDENDCRMAYFGYDEKAENYFLRSFGHNQAAYTNTIETKIQKAIKKDDQIMITVLMYKLIPTKEGFKVYKDMNSEEMLTQLKYKDEVDLFTTYENELQQYRYTFTLENGKYIFTQIKKIN